MKNTLQEQKEKLERELKDINDKIKEESEKTEWIKISNDFICSVNSNNGKCIYEISKKQLYNGKTYQKIKESLKDNEFIADYPLLQKLRNSNKFPDTFNKFWVFVPNPDKISEQNGYVARFYACSGYAVLDCDYDASDSDSTLGVFVVRKIEVKNGK